MPPGEKRGGEFDRGAVTEGMGENSSARDPRTVRRSLWLEGGVLGREGTNSVPGGLSGGSLCCRCLFGCNMDTNEKGRWRKECLSRIFQRPK